MYLYVIGSDKPPYKIGYSSDPIGRLRQLQTGSPAQLECHFAAKDDCAPRYEKQMHTELARCRTVGEWFDAPIDTIINLALSLGLMRHNVNGRKPECLVLPETDLASLLSGVCDAELFRKWRESLRLSRLGAAELLGMGRNQPQRYEDGQEVPKYVAMAMASVFLNTSGWTQDK